MHGATDLSNVENKERPRPARPLLTNFKALLERLAQRSLSDNAAYRVVLHPLTAQSKAALVQSIERLGVTVVERYFVARGIALVYKQADDGIHDWEE